MEIRGKAPLRIGLAGGGTDLEYIFEKYGGAVVNITIDKFCHMSIKIRDDNKIFVNGYEERPFILKKILENYEVPFGFDLIYYNDIQPGSGLGNSSSFVVLFLKIIDDLQNKVVDDFETIKQAHQIELHIKEGGWQDQYATTFGGINFIEFNKEKRIYPLNLRYRFLCELNEHLLLVDIYGQKQQDIHKELREYSETHNDEMEKTAKIKDLAFRMRDCLLNQRIDEIGKILHENWELKRNKFTSNKNIDSLYKMARLNGAIGGKICGSGQAGHFLFFCKPKDRNNLINKIESEGYKTVPFNFAKQGAETWRI
ncbi:MAG: hypothetical protein IIA87_03390 [Nanoarchaeota archaeon]|nr:hypothetical protein [Nanoarchaeota archaeon]